MAMDRGVSLFIACVGVLAGMAAAYDNPVLPENGTWSAFAWQPAVVNNPNYGLHVFTLGANKSLYHKYQTGNFSANNTITMSDWICLTPDNGITSAGLVPLIFWDDPVAIVNDDGRIEVFIRLKSDNDLWQIYQQDAKDPLSFTQPRGPTCLCNFPPCVDQNQTKCGVSQNCDNQGLDCSDPSVPAGWNNHAPFPTSNMNAMKVDGRVQVVYRGFDGRMYMDRQVTPGNSTRYVGGPIVDSIFE